MSDYVDATGTITSAQRPDPPPTGVRRPRGLVKLGPYGEEKIVPGWISWSVNNNSFYEADTFRISYSLSALPRNYGLDWFSREEEIFAEIFAGFPTDPEDPTQNELESLIYGRVDDVEINPITRELTLIGRDLTAAFIDARSLAQYQNQFSSDVIRLLAAQHGMEADATDTHTFVGTYYNNDQVRVSVKGSEWDEISYLARKENFVAYVEGRTLHFGADPSSTADPFVIHWQAPTSTFGSPVCNVTDMTFSRPLTVAKGIVVTARSAGRKKKVPVVESYPSRGGRIQAGKASPFGHVQPYVIDLKAGMTPAEVEAAAKSYYDTLVSHAMKLTARLPAVNSLKIGRPILVSGTQSAFDQIYYPRAIEREMSVDEGYSMTVQAQNSNPALQAVE